jgi:hypothetical protein
MKGALRPDLARWMMDWTGRTDFALAMGTSLSGMRADGLVTSVARRFLAGLKPDATAADKAAAGCGAVIVNLQRTRLDSVASLRIFAKTDEVMALLLQKLGIPATAVDMRTHPLPAEGYEWIPPNGKRIPDDRPPKNALPLTGAARDEAAMRKFFADYAANGADGDDDVAAAAKSTKKTTPQQQPQHQQQQQPQQPHACLSTRKPLLPSLPPSSRGAVGAAAVVVGGGRSVRGQSSSTLSASRRSKSAAAAKTKTTTTTQQLPPAPAVRSRPRAPSVSAAAARKSSVARSNNTTTTTSSTPPPKDKTTPPSTEKKLKKSP